MRRLQYLWSWSWGGILCWCQSRQWWNGLWACLREWEMAIREACCHRTVPESQRESQSANKTTQALSPSSSLQTFFKMQTCSTCQEFEHNCSMDVRDYPFIAFWHGRLKKENPCKKKEKEIIRPTTVCCPPSYRGRPALEITYYNPHQCFPDIRLHLKTGFMVCICLCGYWYKSKVW